MLLLTLLLLTAADRTGSTWIFTISSTPKIMQVQTPVSSALQGRRPNCRYGFDRTGPRRGCCHCHHERVQAGVGENWRQYSYLSGSSMDLEGVRIATPPNVTRALIRRYQYHQPGALAEGGGQALEDASCLILSKHFLTSRFGQFAVPFYCHVSLKKVRGLITIHTI